MTRWWLIPAILIGALIWAVIFGAARAQDIYRWNAETYVTIQPSNRTGVEAEVSFLNTGIHMLNRYQFSIETGGIAVDVEVTINTHGADDTMTVTPPPGYIAWPPEVVVPEGGAGTILILLEATS